MRAGSSDFSEGGQLVTVMHIFIHPRYSGFSYDLSLIHLNEAFLIGSNIRPIYLPDPGWSAPVGSDAIVTGWGRTVGFFFVAISEVDLKLNFILYQ